ncbi:MAG: DUF721 domain-containing protein [Bacteroidia bacterium]
MNKKVSDKPLKEAIDRFLELYGMDVKFQEIEVINTYNKLMGQMIVSKTEKIWFKNGTLNLRLNSSVLKQELNYNKSKIAELINEDLGKELIQEVVIR